LARPCLRHGEDAMVSREYYLKQAALCRRLARNSTDEEFSQRVLALATEYEAKAQAESDPPDETTKSE
jgi:hypothetical protein